MAMKIGPHYTSALASKREGVKDNVARRMHVLRKMGLYITPIDYFLCVFVENQEKLFLCLCDIGGKRGEYVLSL